MNEKKSKIKYCFLGLVLLPLLLFEGCDLNAMQSPVSQSSFFLNTIVTITLFDGSDPKLIHDCFSLCETYEKEFSRTDENSSLYRLNQEKGTVRLLSSDLEAVIRTGLSYYAPSNGLFDITIAPLSNLWDFSLESFHLPDEQEITQALSLVNGEKLSLIGNQLHYEDVSLQLDLGALAKGYIADRLKDYLVEQGVTRAILDLGGNILCIGEKSENTPFRIGIREPFSPQGTSLAVVLAKNLSIVTCGVYERYGIEENQLYHHILNPKTGYPIHNGLSSVSILSASSLDGDALSTVCFTLGKEKGMELINSMPDIYAVFITDENEMILSEGCEQFLETE